MRPQEETVLWVTSEGVKCVLARYDDLRYQLRLIRAEGTIKADLFASVGDAIAAGDHWRAKVDEYRSDDWLQHPARKESDG